MTVRLVWFAALLAAPLAAATPPPGLEAMLAYPFVNELVAADKGERIAWLTTIKGVRNVWTATTPGFAPRQVTHAIADDGQELTGLTFSPDGSRLAWVRGGDHDANWPAEGGLQPNPANDLAQPKLTIWTALASGGAAVAVTEGDHPALSATGRLAYLKDGAVWTAAVDGGKATPERLFFDSGKDATLAWSPDGGKLAFVSKRGDHSFVGVYDVAAKSVTWLTPSTGHDEDPVWSADGRRLAFTHRPGEGGAPEPYLTEVAHPWSIRVADAVTGEGHEVWHSPKTLDGSFPEVPGGVGLRWAAGDRLTFRAEMDGWAHLYAVPAAGGEATLLTPGKFIVENVRPTHDARALLYTANTGPDASDDDRRHVFRVGVDGGAPVQVTPGTGLEFLPVPVGERVAYVAVTALRPASVHVTGAGGDRAIDATADAYPAASLVVPQRVTFEAADGLTIHGQLFTPNDAGGGAAKKPAVIFVHGGPPRQMLLGWSYMDYYSNAYAVNQYLASRGFVVLSVNYRLGIGYGRAFQHAAKAGPAGGSEYLDVVAGAKYLRTLPTVDPARIGIWGGSYGGYLTGLALARDSAIFKAGADLHGVHDWSRLLAEEATPAKRYEQGEWQALLKTAFASSPAADVATWRSPVLLIQGDDDRNVRFNQTIDLARRLDAVGVDYEELVLPNEIHGFLRYDSWLKADSATVRFLEAKLKP